MRVGQDLLDRQKIIPCLGDDGRIVPAGGVLMPRHHVTMAGIQSPDYNDRSESDTIRHKGQEVMAPRKILAERPV